jgi:hypothetical protein
VSTKTGFTAHRGGDHVDGGVVYHIVRDRLLAELEYRVFDADGQDEDRIPLLADLDLLDSFE